MSNIRGKSTIAMKGVLFRLLNRKRKQFRPKMGSGAYSVSFDCDNKKLSLDLSGNASFMGEDTQCYRNDSTVLLFVAHSYKSSFTVVEKALVTSFDNHDEKTAKHLMLPYYFLFRHYLELELKSFLMGITANTPPPVHDLKRLSRLLQQKLNALKYSKEVSGAKDRIDFDHHKDIVHNLVVSLRDEIKSFKSFEPADEYFRFLYTTGFELQKAQIDFDYNNQTVLFHRINGCLTV